MEQNRRRNLFHHFDIITQTSLVHVKPITSRQQFKKLLMHGRSSVPHPLCRYYSVQSLTALAE